MRLEGLLVLTVQVQNHQRHPSTNIVRVDRSRSRLLRRLGQAFLERMLRKTYPRWRLPRRKSAGR